RGDEDWTCRVGFQCAASNARRLSSQTTGSPPSRRRTATVSGDGLQPTPARGRNNRGSRSPVLLRISTPLAGGRALCEVAKTATLAAHHSHSVDCKAERVRPGKCGNDTPIVSSASWCRLKTVTRYGRRTSPRRRGTSRLSAQTSGVRCCALKTNPVCPNSVSMLRGYAQASVQHLLLHR